MINCTNIYSGLIYISMYACIHETPVFSVMKVSYIIIKVGLYVAAVELNSLDHYLVESLQ